MKKHISLVISLALLFFLTTCTFTEDPPPPDYLSLMAEAAAAGDIEAGREIEAEQRALAAETGSKEPILSFEELYLLSQFIYLKAGNARLSKEYRMCTGELVLNRMASPEFPNTLRGVFLQMDGDIAVLASPGITDTVPSRDCVDAAMRLLLGERMMEPSVVYQIYERKGDIFATFADKLLGFTYFCRSENLELYPALQGTALSSARSPVPDAVTG